MVSFEDMDMWLAKGFGGIINMLHTRITQFQIGFGPRAQRLVANETARLAELNVVVQSLPQEVYPVRSSSLDCLDRWFTKAFSGLDTFLSTRSEEGPERISLANLRLMETHAHVILDIVEEERKKHPPQESKE